MNHLLYTKHFLKKSLISFSCASSPLLICKILKDFESRSRALMTHYNFGSKMTHLIKQGFFWGKKNHFFKKKFHAPFGPFYYASKKKFLVWIHSYEVTPFLGPKCFICQKWFFFFFFFLRKKTELRRQCFS